MKAETQLGELRTEIDKLSAGHEQGAKVLRRKAQALAALPREMRDAIFEQIYVQKNPIVVSCSRHGNGLLFDMPKDTALYMSSLHVGESLAREAAEIFWKSNTFTFNIGSAYRSFRPRHGSGLWVQSELDEWSTTDHYGSGNPPQDYIRHASLRINRLSYYYDAALTSDWQMSHVDKICNHIYFESICRDVVAGSLHDYRERLRSFLGFSGLKSLKVEIGDLWHRFDTVARILNPIARDFRQADVKFMLDQPAMHEGAEHFELSHIFDTPSEEDYAEYYQETQRRSVFSDDPKRDVFDSWTVIDSGFHATTDLGTMVKAYMPGDRKFGFMRVWLQEHHEMIKFLSRDFEGYMSIERLVQEFRLLTPDEQDLRRRFIPRILKYCR